MVPEVLLDVDLAALTAEELVHNLMQESPLLLRCDACGRVSIVYEHETNRVDTYLMEE